MSSDYEHTQVLATDADRARAEERAARDRQLGTVRTDGTGSTEVTAPTLPPRRTTDKFHGALGLFLLRLVTAAIMGVHGYQHLTDIHAFTDFVSKVGLPSPTIFAWVIALGEVLAAVALLFGVFTRLAGAGVAAIAIGALAMVMWGKVNPFQSGSSGFTGELELLLAAVGILFFLLGGGRWAVDAGVRLGRQRARAGL